MLTCKGTAPVLCDAGNCHFVGDTLGTDLRSPDSPVWWPAREVTAPAQIPGLLVICSWKPSPRQTGMLAAQGFLPMWQIPKLTMTCDTAYLPPFVNETPSQEGCSTRNIVSMPACCTCRYTVTVSTIGSMDFGPEWLSAEMYEDPSEAGSSHLAVIPLSNSSEHGPAKVHLHVGIFRSAPDPIVHLLKDLGPIPSLLCPGSL